MRASRVHDRLYVLERAARFDRPTPEGISLEELILADRQIQSLRRRLAGRPDPGLVGAAELLLDDPDSPLYRPRTGGALKQAIGKILARHPGP